MLLISIAITIFFANYTYHAYISWQDAEKDVQTTKDALKITTDECLQTKADFIQKYGEAALPAQYKHMCE